MLQWLALLLIVAASIFLIYYFYLNKKERVIALTYQDLFQLFVISSGIYAIYSLLITLAFMSTYRIEQYLYLANFGLIYLLVGKVTPVFENKGLPVRRWGVVFALILAAIALMTFVAINSHGEMTGAHRRFD